MPPKTTTATKRTKKGGKARQTPIVEAAVPAEEFPDDPPAEEEELDAVVEPEETQGATTSQPAPAKAQPKKRNRVSHREIEDYHFTPEQVTQLVDFLKEHPQMYDRRHREFCNTPAKVRVNNIIFLSSCVNITIQYDIQKPAYILLLCLIICANDSGAYFGL